MFALFSCGPVFPRIRNVVLHTARGFVRNLYPLEYDLFREQPMTEIAAVERDVFPFPELDAFVEHEQFQLCVLEKSAWGHVVQPVVRHQQGERLPEFQAAVENFHLPAERGIGDEYVPLRRFVSEEILPVADMGIHDFETGIPEFQHELAMLRVERTPDYLAFGYILDDGQHPISRRIFFIRRITVQPF